MTTPIFYFHFCFLQYMLKTRLLLNAQPGFSTGWQPHQVGLFLFALVYLLTRKRVKVLLNRYLIR